jgi:HlyD family secretion protein
MSASVDIFTQLAENILSVPIISVTAKEDEKKAVKKEDEDVPESKQSKSNDVIKEIVFVTVGDTVAIREVKTGIQDNDHIEIRSGLQEGEEVVTGPYSAIARKLKSGAHFTIAEKKKSGEKNDASNDK